jgi:hypothetical protein
VETALLLLLEAQKLPTFAAVRDLVSPPPPAVVPHLEIPELDLTLYDELIPGSEKPCLRPSPIMPTCARS